MSAETLAKRDRASRAHAVALRACRATDTRNDAALDALERAHRDVLRACDEFEHEICAVAYSMTEGRVSAVVADNDDDNDVVDTRRTKKGRNVEES